MRQIIQLFVIFVIILSPAVLSGQASNRISIILDDLKKSKSDAEKRNAIKLLHKTGKTAIPELISLIKSSDKLNKLMAITILGNCNAFEAVNEIANQVNDSDKETAETAIVSLSIIENKNSGDVLLNILSQEKDNSRIGLLMSALAFRKDKRAINIFRRNLKSGNMYTKLQAAESLAVFGAREGFGECVNLVLDQDNSVRYNAYIALAGC